ncbi:MAG: LysR family transcriptional regulator [Rhodocyclaceae bacterium]|nr:LysR family transcriptional regulator [Rhodocyclaceae bacterium]
MHDLKRMAVFAAVASAGSLGGAARQLGMSTSAVSQHLQLLERAAGLRLVNRTTRRMALTDAGQAFAAHCQAMVQSADAAWRFVEQDREVLSGTLRIAAPMGFARHIAPALAPLLEANPSLQLDLRVSDELIDLVTERIDLALRGGRLPDSGWIARRLCTLDRVICASPAYLARLGTPQQPDDLDRHRWLGPTGGGTGMGLELAGLAGEAVSWRGAATVLSNHQQSLEQLCVGGLGLAVLVRADVEACLQAGSLRVVLPDWRLEGIPIWAVTGTRAPWPARVSRAEAALRGHLAGLAGARV